MDETPIRKEVENIPHTDEVDIILPRGGTHIDVFSGHVPIALQTLSLIFGERDPEEEKPLLWGITHDLIQEIANQEGWLYQNEYLVREYDCEHGSAEDLIDHETSANRVFDQIWLLKDYIQEIGVAAYFEICQTLDGDDEEAIREARKEFIARDILNP